MFMGHNFDVSDQFLNQGPSIDTRYFLNSEVSISIMKPDDNVSKPIIHNLLIMYVL